MRVFLWIMFFDVQLCGCANVQISREVRKSESPKVLKIYIDIAFLNSDMSKNGMGACRKRWR